MEVLRASGYTSCKFLDVGWPSVQQLRTLKWVGGKDVDEDEEGEGEGEEEGGQQEDGSSSDGE
eukprot:167403-Pelagomonas_calceolata.AAC.2